MGGNIDLTVVQFNSSKSYQVAKIGDSDNAKRRDNVYAAGFPAKTGVINAYLFECRDGQINANATQVTIDGGYNLIYNNKILKGMSGRPVLNQKGELIGINGLIEENNQGNTDRYAAVPVNTYVRIAARQPIKPQRGGLKADVKVIGKSSKYFNICVFQMTSSTQGDNCCLLTMGFESIFKKLPNSRSRRVRQTL